MVQVAQIGGRGGEVIRAMPERKHLFLQEVFPLGPLPPVFSSDPSCLIVMAEESTEMKWERLRQKNSDCDRVQGGGKRHCTVGGDRELAVKDNGDILKLRKEGDELGFKGSRFARGLSAGRKPVEVESRASSPHSHSSRRRIRLDDNGNVVKKKKIELDGSENNSRAAPDPEGSFIPAIGEMEELIRKGRMEAENTAAVPQLQKDEGMLLKRWRSEGELKNSETATVNSLKPVFSQEERTLFVVGLSEEVQDHDVKEYFGRFGEIERTTVVHSRGFVFVVFKDMAARMDATSLRKHVIKGKEVKCHRSGPGLKEMKVFVGNLPLEGHISDDEIADHFSQYGPVADVIQPRDETNNPKPFCFVVFDKEETGRKLIEQGFSTLRGQRVVIKSVSL